MQRSTFERFLLGFVCKHWFCNWVLLWFVIAIDHLHPPQCGFCSVVVPKNKSPAIDHRVFLSWTQNSCHSSTQSSSPFHDSWQIHLSPMQITQGFTTFSMIQKTRRQKKIKERRVRSTRRRIRTRNPKNS